MSQFAFSSHENRRRLLLIGIPPSDDGIQVIDLSDIPGPPQPHGGKFAALRYRHEDRKQVEIGLVKTGANGRAWRRHICTCLHVNILLLMFFLTTLPPHH